MAGPPEALREEIARFAGESTAVIVGCVRQPLRAPYNVGVTGMTIDGAPRPRALLALLRLHPHLITLTLTEPRFRKARDPAVRDEGVLQAALRQEKGGRRGGSVLDQEPVGERRVATHIKHTEAGE